MSIGLMRARLNAVLGAQTINIFNKDYKVTPLIERFGFFLNHPQRLFNQIYITSCRNVDTCLWVISDESQCQLCFFSYQLTI